MRKKLFTLLLATMASISALFAESGTCGANLTWDLTNGVLTISGTGEMDDYYTNSPWYSSRSSITSLIIGNSVTSIGSWAFENCTGLTSVTIPNSVTSIGDWAFYECSSLSSVTIPNSVTSIGDYAFAYCTSLTSVTIPNSVTSIGSWAFSGCSSLTSVTIGNSVISIGEHAFGGCSGLTSVTIPNSVTSIGDKAFYNCTGLTMPIYNDRVFAYMPISYSGAYAIPDGIESITGGAFYNCTGLTSVSIPNSVTSIGSSAFSFCIGVKSLILSSNWVKYENSDNLYICGEVTDDGRRRNNDNYVWMNRLEYIEAPAWFFDVSEENWAYCPKQLENVVVNNGELSSNGFAVISRSYKSLKSLDLSSASNTELADEAIKNFYNITELKLPRNTERIGYMSVAECVKLQSIDIPASVIEIEDRAFENCRSLKTITFGGQASSAPGRFNALASSNSQLQRIGNWAFYNCHELQNLEIPEGVTEIGDGAFYGCTYLENLTLPASVQSIGDNTFALCAKMKKIVVNAVTPPSIQAKTFFDVKRQIPVYVPDESISAYLDDPQWSEFNIQGISHMPEALEQTPSDQPSSMTHKLLRDGQILIQRGDRTYTVTGQEIK